jgi:hypothetical protein
MIKILSTSALILAVALPVKAQVGPGLGRTDYRAQNYRPQDYGVVCTKNYNGRLSLRTGPGQNYRKIAEIPNGYGLALNSGRYGSDGFWWWNASIDGYQGWARADYICDDPQ